MKVTVPYNFTPRDYQFRVLKALEEGYKRAVLVWHRRAGKDKTALNIVVKKAFERVGNYYYYLPTAALGRKIVWQGKDRDGFPFLGHVPQELRSRTREDEMRIELINGSAIQVIGTDKTDVVGPNPVGCIFSEYSLQDPAAWNYIRPILAENDGWAIFLYTPRGRNHGYTLFQMAKYNPSWYCELLTADDTNAITPEAIEEERASGMSEELIQQEFFASFDYGMEGSYYTKQLARARQEGRITRLPIQDISVHTAWDIGYRDATAIWFFQFVGKEIWVIDYYENSGEELAHYAKVLQEKGYIYGEHWAPHDIEKHELGTGASLRERAKDLGLEFNVIENWSRTGIGLAEGIEVVRSLFPRFWFHEENTKRGLDALSEYKKKWDPLWATFSDQPAKNWARDGADAFRILSLAVLKETRRGRMTETEAQNLYEAYAPPAI